MLGESNGLKKSVSDMMEYYLWGLWKVRSCEVSSPAAALALFLAA